jgi:hypothetical protein
LAEAEAVMGEWYVQFCLIGLRAVMVLVVE